MTPVSAPIWVSRARRHGSERSRHGLSRRSIHSFYGRLSVSNNNVDDLRAGNIPPTFYTYGTEAPFYRQFNQNVEAVRQAGVQVESHVLDGWPHGFGVRGEWTTWFDRFLQTIMKH